MSESSVWEELLEEFRVLGGRADNVRPGQGKYGRGLLPIDPTKPVELNTPENLLFPVNELLFEKGALRVGTSSKAGEREIAWFERYAAELSWGGDGRRHVEQFISGMQELPLEVRTLLGNGFGLDYCLAPLTEVIIERYFLNARAISYRVVDSTGMAPESGDPDSPQCLPAKKPRKVIMPVIELANHGDEASFEFGGGISLRGLFEEEVLVKYSRQDPWGMFRGWGFACESPAAFSRFLRVNMPFGDLVVQRHLEKEKPREVPGVGTVLIPELTVAGNEVTLSSLMLGNRLAPRIPRGIFQCLFREAGLPNDDETFDKVRQTNSLAFLNLLDLLESVTGQQAATLRSMARLQLRAIANCYGSRPI